jgi:TolB-like protein
MKTKIGILLTFFLTGLLVQAAPPGALTVAVYDFKGDGPAASWGSKVTTLVTASLSAAPNVVLLERKELSAELNEQAFGVSGLVSADAAAKIGQITGAKVLVSGQVLKTGDNHLVIVATVIGTETGRLFADQVEGGGDDLMDLTTQLSQKIAQTIGDQATNLVAAAILSNADRLDQLIKNLTGTNRPSVSVTMLLPNHKAHSATAEAEFGNLLLKAGFPVVDGNSDRKPDVEITGVLDESAGANQGRLHSFEATIELKVQERENGTILSYDRAQGMATDTSKNGANRSAQVNAVDALAERVLPLLAK